MTYRGEKNVLGLECFIFLYNISLLHSSLWEFFTKLSSR